MTYETIETRRDGHIGVITLNRPAQLNAINDRLTQEVKEVVADFSADPEVRAILLHGAGRAFSAGFDMKETDTRNYSTVPEWQDVLQRDFDFIMQFWDCPKPTIAAVHGHCLAGGFELALACDVTVAAEGTFFGEPEVRFGASIVAMLLPWFTGPKQAKELLLTGNDKVAAKDALAMGFINHVVPAGEEFDKAMSIARDMAAASAVTVQGVKRVVNHTYNTMGMHQALTAALQSALVMTASGGPEREEFNRIRREQGLKAALAWRDAKFV